MAHRDLTPCEWWRDPRAPRWALGETQHGSKDGTEWMTTFPPSPQPRAESGAFRHRGEAPAERTGWGRGRGLQQPRPPVPLASVVPTPSCLESCWLSLLCRKEAKEAGVFWASNVEADIKESQRKRWFPKPHSFCMELSPEGCHEVKMA